MNFKLIARSVSILTVLGAIPAFAAGETQEQLAMQKEGIALIRQVEEVARDVRYNAARLDSFVRGNQFTKWTHSHHLTEIKNLVNDGLNPALTRLREIQPHLPEWKQQSIDKMMESAVALAGDTNSAIISRLESGSVPPALDMEYRDLVTKIYGHAETLVKTSDAAGNYAQARLKAAEVGVNVPKH